MKMMRRHQKKNLLQIFVCLTLLVRLSSSSFLLQTATDSSLADRESQIIGDSSFGLTRRDRKLDGSKSRQLTQKASNSDLKNAIECVMVTVKEKLVFELKKYTTKETIDNCSMSNITGLPLKKEGNKNINEYFLPDSKSADVYGWLSCCFDVASESWTVTADLFDQGGENSDSRENYNLMISIQVADKGITESEPKIKPFYEDKHLLAVNLSRQGYKQLLDAEIESILKTFISDQNKITNNSLIKSSIDDIYCKLYEKIESIIGKNVQSNTEESSSVKNSKSLSDKTDTSSKTGHISVDNVIFDQLDLSLSNTNGSSAIFKAEVGSLVFTMIVPRRGWENSENTNEDDNNGSQILKSFETQFKTWWEKVQKNYPVTVLKGVNNSLDKTQESNFVSHIKKYIMEGLGPKNICFKEIGNEESSGSHVSTFTVLPSEPNNEKQLSKTFVIHLYTNGSESNNDNSPCAHTKSNHKSSEYITIYFHHFTSGSLNYGHLAIDSETQYVESLVDLSKDIESSIKSQIQDFLKSDEYVGVDQMKGHIFTQNDIFELLIEKGFKNKLKCITRQSGDNTNYQGFVEEKPEDFFKEGRLKNSMFACANKDENSKDFNFDNMVLNAQKIENNLVDIRLTWPKNFDHNNLNGSNEIKYGLDMQFDFPEYNAYDQICDKIGDRIVKFLNLITCKQNRQRELQTVQGSKLQQLIGGRLINTNNQRNLQKTKPDSKVLQPGVEADINLSLDNKQPEESNTNSIKPNGKLVNYDRTLTNSSTQIIGPKKTSIENELSLEKLSKIANEQSRVFDFEPIYNHPLTVRRYVKKTLNLANQSWFDLQRFSTNNIHENSSSESLVTEKLAINKIAP